MFVQCQKERFIGLAVLPAVLINAFDGFTQDVAIELVGVMSAWRLGLLPANIEQKAARFLYLVKKSKREFP